ncbi:hypothetical protein JHK86_047794 [Glycine max]|nr:hypothetical protein JHK86_047794 [Glycine max]
MVMFSTTVFLRTVINAGLLSGNPLLAQSTNLPSHMRYSNCRFSFCNDRAMASHIVGYPHIGPKRELKSALESFWDGKSNVDDL